MGDDLHTAICTGCGLVFASPIPTSEEIGQFYSKDYRLRYKGVSQPKLKHVFRAGNCALLRYPLVAEYAVPGSRVLDVGSGGGEFVYLLKSRGYQARGIEADEGYGGYSIDEYGIDVQIGPFDGSQVGFENYDLVTAHHVVEHLRDPLDVFRGVHQALRQDGHFIVEVPNVESQYHTPSNKWHFAHIFNFNANTLENMGRRAGFEIVKTDFISTCQHVRTLFRKSERVCPLEISHENYRRVKLSLDEYTDWHHFTSLMPAKRLWTTLSKLMREKMIANESLSGKQILDRIYGVEDFAAVQEFAA